MALALTSQLKVGIVSHPSLLTVPDELNELRKKSIPFLWETCENDFMVCLSSLSSFFSSSCSM